MHGHRWRTYRDSDEPTGLRKIKRFTYALDRSYVLLARPPIEPISHPIRAWVPLTEAQRIEELTYESPALPLSYSAAHPIVSSVIESGYRGH